MAKTTKGKTTYERVESLLQADQLQQALMLLSAHCREVQLFGIADEADALLKDYNRMLDFFSQGSKDNQRDELLDGLFDRCWQLNEKLYDAEIPSPSYTNTEDIAKLLDQLCNEPTSDTALNAVFEQIAECRHLSADSRKALHAALLDESLPEFVRATLLGAVTLQLTQSFDARLVEDLYTFTLDDQPVQLQMEAWVTLVFVALIHSHRIEHLPRLREQYRFLCEDNPEQVFAIQIALLQCREAFNFDRKLHQIVDSEGNEDEISQKERAREFFEFISEGVDTSLTMFSQLKKISFFSSPGTRHHWFEPFSLEEPHVKAILARHPDSLAWTKMLMHSVAQCETDKYAAFMSMQALNQDLMSALSKKLEETGLSTDQIQDLSPLWVMRNYLHDLYRYCNMHPKAEEMRYKLFDRNLLMTGNPCLKAAVCTTERLRKISEFLFRKEHWPEAAVVYKELIAEELTEESLQKLAYAQMQPSDTASAHDAIETLTRCDLLFPGNRWTLRHLADRLDHAALYDEELVILRKAIEKFPNDKDFLWRLGRCLIYLDRPGEALEPLFKADLQKEGQHRVQREIARASFLLHNQAQANRYILPLLSRENAASEDWLLGAHIALKDGNIKLAFDRYLEVADKNYNPPLVDRDLLLKVGIPQRNISLIGDLIYRQFNNLQ